MDIHVPVELMMHKYVPVQVFTDQLPLPSHLSWALNRVIT